MAINLHAYDFYQFDDLTFIFTTLAGDEYQCFFLSYADYFLPNPI